jgi:hypothetical protein
MLGTHPHAALLGELSFPDAFQLSLKPKELISRLQNAGVLERECSCTDCEILMKLEVYSRHADGLCWRCPNPKCRKRISIRIGSYFEKSRLPLSVLFRILFCYMRYDKMFSKYVADIAGTTEQTLCDWGNFIRETISHYFLENPIVLGDRHAVQIDESLFGGKRKYHRGNHNIHEQSWVFGMVEEATNLNVMWLVENRTRGALLSIIKDHIKPGSTIKSDEWASYSTLTREGFEHLTVNHSVHYVSDEGVHTQLVESLWSQVKSVLKIKRGTQVQHLAGYLDYHSFLSLAKHRGLTAFDMFLELIQVRKCY